MKFKHYTRFHSMLGEIRGIVRVSPDAKTNLILELLKEVDEVFLDAVGEYKPKPRVSTKGSIELGAVKKNQDPEETPEEEAISETLDKK